MLILLLSSYLAILVSLSILCGSFVPNHQTNQPAFVKQTLTFYKHMEYYKCVSILQLITDLFTLTQTHSLFTFNYTNVYLILIELSSNL